MKVEARDTSAVARLPFDPKCEFGRVRAPVQVTANGYTFRTTMRYGGTDFVGFNRTVRDQAGIRPGDTVTLSIVLDVDERTVAVPADLLAAFRGASDAADVFGRLSYTHRKEYVRWVEEAKRAETRHSRVEKTIAMLRAGIKHP